MRWIVKSEHQRNDGGTVALELETEDGMYDVNVRWDGCMEIHTYMNTEENRELADTFHTCDVIEFMDTLLSLSEACRDYFGSGYWQPRTTIEEEVNDYPLH
jgi:hypothetical protein